MVIDENDAIRVVQLIEEQASRDVSAHPFDADLWRCRANDMLDGIANFLQFANRGAAAPAAKVICACLEAQARIKEHTPAAPPHPAKLAGGALYR
jgi:hypothetical protein